MDDETLRLYTQFHDCGKPLCRIVDQDGRVHFPNHAEVSAQVWRENCSLYSIIENLIRMDMVVYTMPACDVPEFAKKPEAVSILFAALAEVHANAELFGGIESTSFKIKWKHIDKRGCALNKIFKV